MQRPHGLGDGILRDREDASTAGEHDRDRVRVGVSARDAIGEGRGGVGGDHAPGSDREGRRRRLLRDDADDLGRKPEQVTHGQEARDARSHADRRVHGVELRHGREQLEAVRGHAAGEVGMERWHHLEPALGRNRGGVLASLLEVPAVLDHLGAEPSHRGVLLGAVAVRHEDHDRHPVRAAGVGEALAVVAARGGDDPGDVWTLAHQTLEVDQPATHLERARGRVVLVLDPHLDRILTLAHELAEQGPDVLGCRREVAADERLGAPQLVELEEHSRQCTGGRNGVSNDLDWLLNLWPDQAALRRGESDLEEPA
jgi:hypothetical protein